MQSVILVMRVAGEVSHFIVLSPIIQSHPEMPVAVVFVFAHQPLPLLERIRNSSKRAPSPHPDRVTGVSVTKGIVEVFPEEPEIVIKIVKNRRKFYAHFEVWWRGWSNSMSQTGNEGIVMWILEFPIDPFGTLPDLIYSECALRILTIWLSKR